MLCAFYIFSKGNYEQIILIFVLFWVAFVSGVCFSCGKSPTSDVIVTVNGKKITNKDVADRLQEHKNTDADTLDALKLEIVDRLIMDILLDEFIDKHGLLVTQDEIDREVEKIRYDIAGSQKKYRSATGTNSRTDRLWRD